MKVWDHQGVKIIQGKVSVAGLASIKIFLFLWDGSLIDTGPSRLGKGILPVLKSSLIERVLITHFHEDHSGNAAALQRERNIKVYISPLSAEICRLDAPIPLYRRYVWGGRRKFDPTPLGDFVASEKGPLDVIGTPGHSHDHVCFLDRERGFVFTGDLFVTPKTKTVMRNESIPQIMRSIRSLLKEDFGTLYCAHAGVVEKGRRMMENKLDYLENLQGEAQRLHRKGLSVKEIEKKFFKPQFLTFFSGGEWSPRHIISSMVRGI